MSEEKKMPKWGDIVHVDGEPFVVVRLRGGDWVEVADKFGKWHGLLMDDFDEYKLCTITINGMEVPEPERKPLNYGQDYWVAHVSEPGPFLNFWGGWPFDYRYLENGLIHLTQKNAEAHINAMRRANKGYAG